MPESITATQAGNNIQKLIDETAESHRPILITTKNQNAVLLSEEDWNALQETVQLLSMPGMRESIVREMNAPDGDFISEADFLAEIEKSGDDAN